MAGCLSKPLVAVVLLVLALMSRKAELLIFNCQISKAVSQKIDFELPA
jgi:hypothetical protein